jgi:hypothetical protein
MSNVDASSVAPLDASDVADAGGALDGSDAADAVEPPDVVTVPARCAGWCDDAGACDAGEICTAGTDMVNDLNVYCSSAPTEGVFQCMAPSDCPAVAGACCMTISVDAACRPHVASSACKASCAGEASALCDTNLATPTTSTYRICSTSADCAAPGGSAADSHCCALSWVGAPPVYFCADDATMVRANSCR